MKATMFTRSVYLSIVLIVTVAVGGCIMWPGKTTYNTPEKPSGLKEGKMNRTLILEKLGNPREQTADGRLGLHGYTRTRRLHSATIPWEGPGYWVDEFRARFLLLVVYDENDIVKRLEQYKCKPQKYKKDDPVCSSQDSICGVLVAIDDPALVKRYCDATVVEYYREVALIESLEKPLREAVKRGDLERIKQLIEQGADINAPGEPRRKPLLMVAAKRGDVAVVELLLENGVEINEKTRSGGTALLVAVKNGHADIVKTLLAKGADVNAGPWEKPLYWAAANGDVTIAQLLLAAGADVDAGGPLYRAVKKGHEEMVKLLIAAGADVDATHNDTPLSRAVKKGHEEMVKLLIAAGADVNAGPYGKEPLSRAVRKGYEDIAQLLVVKGANVNVIDGKGRTLLHLAAAKGRTSLADLLLANGADVNAKDSRGKTPLRLATDWRHKETIALLKRHGAKE